MILRAYCFIPLPALLAHLSLALSMCQPQNVALNSFFFLFFLKSLFHSPLRVKILFVALSSDPPFR